MRNSTVTIPAKYNNPAEFCPMLFGSEPLAWIHLGGNTFQRVSDETLAERLKWVEKQKTAKVAIIKHFNLPLSWDGKAMLLTSKEAKALNPHITHLRSTKTVKHDIDYKRIPSNWILPEGKVKESKWELNGCESFGSPEEQQIETQQWEGQRIFKLQNAHDIQFCYVSDI